jgi:tetratricopeptide (TPR) repeat protein
MSHPRQAAACVVASVLTPVLTAGLTAGLTAVLTSVTIALPARAENPDHMRQLLSTKQCQGCDLSGAGLVLTNLSGANLAGANFSRANLSQSNLTSANLQGARLAGASLAGTNLGGADLMGADLRNADLRGAILTGARLDNADLTGAAIGSAIDLPSTVGTAEMFYQWGLEAAQQKRYERAIGQFDQAVTRDPVHAPSFLGRGIARFEMGDRKGAIGDVELAQNLFKTQGNVPQAEQSEKIVTAMKKPEVSAEGQGGNGLGMGLVNMLGGLLKLLAF